MHIYKLDKLLKKKIYKIIQNVSIFYLNLMGIVKQYVHTIGESVDHN